MVRRKYNEKTGRKEYALVSQDGSRILEWFGAQKPTKDQYKKAEARVQYFKHHG